MEKLLSSSDVAKLIETIKSWLDTHVLDPAAAIQLGIIAIAYVIAIIAAPRVRPALDRVGQILMALWDKLQEHEIELPYPQRDLHLRSAEPLTVEIRRPVPDAGDQVV